jgi:energy-coupling factor transporter transmembrane protein EcfT
MYFYSYLIFLSFFPFNYNTTTTIFCGSLFFFLFFVFLSFLFYVIQYFIYIFCFHVLFFSSPSISFFFLFSFMFSVYFLISILFFLFYFNYSSFTFYYSFYSTRYYDVEMFPFNHSDGRYASNDECGCCISGHSSMRHTGSVPARPIALFIWSSS